MDWSRRFGDSPKRLLSPKAVLVPWLLQQSRGDLPGVSAVLPVSHQQAGDPGVLGCLHGCSEGRSISPASFIPLLKLKPAASSRHWDACVASGSSSLALPVGSGRSQAELWGQGGMSSSPGPPADPGLFQALLAHLPHAALGPGWPPSRERCGELAVPPRPTGQHLRALLGMGHFIFLSLKKKNLLI